MVTRDITISVVGIFIHDRMFSLWYYLHLTSVQGETFSPERFLRLKLTMGVKGTIRGYAIIATTKWLTRILQI